MGKTNCQKVTIDALSPRARKFRQWSMKPYFQAQVNANVYLGQQIGNMLLAGEPQKNEREIHIPVHHGLIGWEKQVGVLRANADTFEIIDDQAVISKIRRTIDELYRKGAFQTRR